MLVRRENWRLMRRSRIASAGALASGMTEPLSQAVFEAWNGLLEGALAVHDRFCVLEVLSRLDWGDEAFVWRVRPRA